MASFSNLFIKTLNTEVLELSGFIALDSTTQGDGYADGYVLPVPPTKAGVAVVGPYTYCKGLTDSIGAQTASGVYTVTTQPWKSTGLYQFTIDNPIHATALVGANITLTDQGAVAQPIASVDANVLGSADTTRQNVYPGCNSTIPLKTVQVKFRNASSGALVNPINGFWMRLLLKQSDVK